MVETIEHVHVTPDILILLLMLFAYEKESQKNILNYKNIHKNMHIHPLCAIVIIIETQNF